jgi:hypothetical protein
MTKGKESNRLEKNYIMRRFVMFNLHQILGSLISGGGEG